MATTPAILTILDKVEARLTKITTANGYHTTVAKVERGRLEPYQGYDLPAINYWLTTVRNEKNAYGQDQRTPSLYIEYHDLTRDESFVDQASKLAADVVTVLNRHPDNPAVDDDPDYNLGEAVTDLRLSGYDYQIGKSDKPWCGALIRFEIEYQTDSMDMFNYEQ